MRKKQLTGLAALAAVTLVFTGCSSVGGDSGGSNGEGVAYGASPEEWAAAFETVEPITLYSQVLYADGDLNNLQYTDYFDAIEELSDGKITFDVAYASSVAPYTEVFDAIVDGRLDIGITSPSFMPVDFPAYAAWTDLIGAYGEKGAFPGVLNTYSWGADALVSDPDVEAEFDAYGLHLLQPFTYAGYDQGLVCREELTTLDDFKGKSIAVSAASQARLAEAIGMTPVSLPFQDWFDALQRGVADCGSNTASSSASLGIFEVAPNLILDPEVFFGNLGQGALAINQDVWNDLPLVAQQLLFDQLPQVTYAALEQTNFQRIIGALNAHDEVTGSSLEEFGPEVRAKLIEVLDGTLDLVVDSGALNGSREELQATIDELTTKWDDTIAEFGYPTFSYSDLLTEWDGADIDLNEWNDVFFEEIFLPLRPA